MEVDGFDALPGVINAPLAAVWARELDPQLTAAQKRGKGLEQWIETTLAMAALRCSSDFRRPD